MANLFSINSVDIKVKGFIGNKTLVRTFFPHFFASDVWTIAKLLPSILQDYRNLKPRKLLGIGILLRFFGVFTMQCIPREGRKGKKVSSFFEHNLHD